jgi:hypothetical protein
MREIQKQKEHPRKDAPYTVGRLIRTPDPRPQ